MVYGTYNYSYWGESKPTNITFGGPTLYILEKKHQEIIDAAPRKSSIDMRKVVGFRQADIRSFLPVSRHGYLGICGSTYVNIHQNGKCQLENTLFNASFGPKSIRFLAVSLVRVGVSYTCN